ncbi:hypothetical protein [Lederbergia lenta]|uniref:Uncharacterized protein n=1 Tax=Lederbergia lenta TaxID=1467 RepID=A0A2X4ZEM0_LEDLE|nr:hypothetical protein [Lederbergia lenta]MEC2324641.1 hypothetical protein [Lederbergia lenta]SQI58914.1 Uncharacterised protein [Lederbergia lenta]
MGVYSKVYSSVLRKNFMLLIIASFLLIVMFAFWIGVPFFVLGNFLFDLNIPNYLKLFFITVFVGMLFTSFFIPINWKVAYEIGGIKQQSKVKVFSYLQALFILISSSIFYLLFSILL